MNKASPIGLKPHIAASFTNTWHSAISGFGVSLPLELTIRATKAVFLYEFKKCSLCHNTNNQYGKDLGVHVKTENKNPGRQAAKNRAL